MIVLNIIIDVKPGQEWAFLEITKPLIKNTRGEPGCHFYNIYRSSNQFVVIEHWANQKALASHNQSDHFTKFIKEARPYFSKELVTHTYKK